MEDIKKNPNLFIEKTIKDYITGNPKNKLEGGPIFDEPLVGFADGDDPIFQEYKKIIGDFHITPREILALMYPGKELPKYISVIGWILPITRETRLSLRKETLVPSLRWNQTRWNGEALNVEMSKYLESLLQGMGYLAVAPMYTEHWHEVELSNGPASNWSYRHACYACGLGTFSLNDAFITPRGIAIRCGSIVCDVPLTPSPRKYANHLANCLFFRDGSCRRCIERCPAKAVSEKGHDKIKCRDFLYIEQKEILKREGREAGYIGKYLGCGLCQTKVPCEEGIPVPPKKIQKK